MLVTELSREQLEELKEAYSVQLADTADEEIYYSDLANASEIPDDIIFRHYAGVTFTDDDFLCTANKNALEREKVNDREADMVLAEKNFKAVCRALNKTKTRDEYMNAWKKPRAFYHEHSVDEAIEILKKENSCK